MDYVDINSLDKQTTPKLIFEANLDISKGIANKSYSIEFPNNSNNNKHLDNIFSKYVGRKISFPAKYTIEGVVLTGVLLVTEITEYIASAVFVTGNGVVWNKMQQDALRNIDLKHRNIVLNKENVLASETGYPFVVFDLTDRGVFKGGLNAIDITDRFPAINISQLLTEIFNYYGFAVRILDYTEYFNKLYLLFTGSGEVENNTEWMQNAAVEATGKFKIHSTSGTGTSFLISARMLFPDEEIDPGNNYTSSIYKAPQDGSYQFKVNYNLKFQRQALATVTNTSAKMYLRKITNNVISEYYSIPFNVDLSEVPYNEFSGIFDSKLISLKKDDTVEIWIRFSGDIDFEDTWNITVTQGISTKILILPSRWHSSGSTIEISNILPSITVSNFLKNMFSYLNINIFYDYNNNVINLTFGRKQTNPIEQIEVWYYKETDEEKVDTVLQFNTDKARPQPNKIIKIKDSQETVSNKFVYSRTLIAPCTRLFSNTDITIPVLWQSGDPLSFTQSMKPPKQSTIGNMRILKKISSVMGTYLLTYVGDSGLESEEQTEVLQFVEPDIRDLHLYNYSKEKKVIECFAKLNLNKLYNNVYFKNEVTLINRATKVPLLNGVIIKAEQIEGLIYKITVQPTAQDQIDSSIIDWPIELADNDNNLDDFENQYIPIEQDIYTMVNVGSGIGLYKETLYKEFKLKTLTSTDSSVIITSEEDTVNLEVPHPIQLNSDWAESNPDNIKYIENKPDLNEIIEDKYYRHTQGPSSEIWVINHGLEKYPSVSVQDNSGTYFEGQITYIDKNNLILTFSAPFGGYADLN